MSSDDDWGTQIRDAMRTMDRFCSDAMMTSAEGVLAGGELIAKFCKDHHPYLENTGTLTSSWGAGYSVKTDQEVVVVTGSDKEYAPWVELGHSMGRVPRWVPGKFVGRPWGDMFQYQRGGEDGIFIRAPEARPYPTLMPAVEAKKFDVLKLVAMMLQAMARRYDHGPA